MGEVYAAHDTRLNRRVAIKILPEAYAGDPERIARFHREAQAAAALNHPNIAAIYDLAEAPPPEGQTEVVRYLILELIDGDTLADRLRHGPLPVEEALQIAKQILEALEAAHERGICHRDLKPVNVKLTPEGTVKVLDFGLAKFLQNSPSAVGGASHSPTLSLAGTIPGVILGTAGYMSPEQAKGFEADQRSDIFSFGCILFEMLTARQAFEGDTVSEILASVLKTEVDFTRLPPQLNPRLVELLRRCLEKHPKKRWHAAADVRLEIEAVMGQGRLVEDPRGGERRSRPLWKRSIVPVASAVVAGLLVGYSVWMMKPEPVPAVTRFSVLLPEGQQFTNMGRTVVAASPDGNNLVYVANERLYLRAMSSLEDRVIAGSEMSAGVINPVFSPDGQTLIFYSSADRALKRLAISGGTAVTICPADIPFGMNWDEQGIVFGQNGKGILRVSGNGGTPVVVAAVGKGEVVGAPQMLPDGRALLFSVKKTDESWDQGQIVVQPLEGGERKTLIAGGANGRYVPTGHLVFALSGSLLAAPFDLDRLAITGSSVPIVDGVARNQIESGNTSGVAQFSFSTSGTLAYVPGPSMLDSGMNLALFSRNGGVQPLTLPQGQYSSPRVSADGRFAAFERTEGGHITVWVYELGGSRAAQQLTFDSNDRAPVWSPDGQWIAFQSDREGDRAIFRQRADGSGTAERLSKPEAGVAHTPQSWNRDGAQLLFSAEKASESSLWTLTVKDRQVAAFGDVAAREAVFSPDGGWVAYQAGRTPPFNVYLEPFPRTGAKYLVPQSGGHPLWSAKGDEILLNIGSNASRVIAVTTTPRVTFGRPAPFPRYGRSEPNPQTDRRNVDMMPDGQHVIGVPTVGASTGAQVQQITVVLNWFDELRQRVPVK